MNVNAHTRIRFQCTVCHAFCETPLCKLARKQRPGCHCTKRCEFTWSSKEGFEIFKAFVEKLDHHKLQDHVTEHWWTSNVTGQHSKVPFECTVCGQLTNTGVHHVANRHEPGCWCNQHGQWSSEEGRLRFLSILEDTRFTPADWMLNSQEWKNRNVSTRSIVDITCINCSHTCSNTKLMKVVANRSAQCLCRWKTEKMVFDFANVVAAQHNVGVEHQWVLRNKLHSLYCDVAFFNNGKCILVVEVDGVQHFGDAGRALPQCDNKLEKTTQNDLRKELVCVERGIPILRLFQPDVWHGRCNWKSILSVFVDDALNKRLDAAVYVQDSPCYTTGLFAAHRDIGATCNTACPTHVVETGIDGIPMREIVRFGVNAPDE